MLDHSGLNLSDYDRSRDFYEPALAPLAYDGAYILDVDGNNVELVCHHPA